MSANNREAAILFWIALFLLYALTFPAIKKSLSRIIMTFSKPTIAIPFLLMIFYVVSVVYLLRHIGIWTNEQLKTTIFWGISTAIISFVNTDKTKVNSDYLKALIKDNLRILVVVEFIVSFYSFNLICELIIFPLSIIIVVMIATCESEGKYKETKFVLNVIIGVLVLIQIIYSTYMLTINFDSFATKNTAIDFFLPILMSVFLIPFIYGMALFSNYNSIYAKLHIPIKNPSVLRYAKYKATTVFNIKTELLDSWFQSLLFSTIKTKEDIDNSIEQIANQSSAEKEPKCILSTEGWSPYLAKDFLSKNNISTGSYGPKGGNSYFTSSPYITIAGNNVLTYCIVGNASFVKELILTLDIHDSTSAEISNKKLLVLIQTLIHAALHESVPREIEQAIKMGTQEKIILPGKSLRTSIERWNNGYSVIFTITHRDNI